jgi:imidazolonepropionase-like amidohydrolase
MVAGSDSAWLNYKMGEFQHELEAMTTIGMSPIEVITASTFDSARSCRIDHETGTLASGLRGDLIVLDGDPSTNISALWNVSEVFANGEIVDRGNLV